MAGNDNDNRRTVGAAIGLGALVGAGIALWTSYSRENAIQEEPVARGFESLPRPLLTAVIRCLILLNIK